MAIQDVRVRREDSQVYIDSRMSDEGEPNLAAWNAARKQIDEYLTDPGITDLPCARPFRFCHANRSSPLQQVPALGYRTFWVHARPTQEKAPRPAKSAGQSAASLGTPADATETGHRKRYARPPYRIENEFFLVELQNNATLTLLDKRTGQRYDGLNYILDGGDCGDEYNYAPPAADRFTSPHV
jgi:hypothetical protein